MANLVSFEKPIRLEIALLTSIFSFLNIFLILDSLRIEEIHQLYKSYVNQGQVNLLASFSPARQLVKKALGQFIYLHDGTKISDFTAGIGVLNHGHNHEKIIKVRRKFQEAKKMASKFGVSPAKVMQHFDKFKINMK